MESRRSLRGYWRDIDKTALAIWSSILLFGLLMVYSSSFLLAEERYLDGTALIKRQVQFAAIGLLVFCFAVFQERKFWWQTAFVLVLFSLFLCALTLVPGIGARVGGANRWIQLGVLRLQPSEFLKVCSVLFMARLLSRKQGQFAEFRKGFIELWIVPLAAIAVLLLQPDFGSSIIIALSTCVLMFLAGVRILYLAGTFAVGGIVAGGLIVTSPYRLARVQAFLDPWHDPAGKGFQLIQSLVGYRQGGWFGVGLGNSREKLLFLPEAHNDFILSVVGEELGILGLAIFLFSVGLLYFRTLRVGWMELDRRQDGFAYLASMGLMTMIAIEVLINTAVTLGMLPTKGLSLPFVSYGGSSMIAHCLAMGICFRFTFLSRQGIENYEGH